MKLTAKLESQRNAWARHGTRSALAFARNGGVGPHTEGQFDNTSRLFATASPRMYAKALRIARTPSATIPPKSCPKLRRMVLSLEAAIYGDD